MRDPILPAATVVCMPPRPGDPMSRPERVLLLLSAVMLTVLLSAALVLPYLPLTAAGW